MRNRHQFVAEPPRRRGGPSWNAVLIAAAVSFLGVAVLVAGRASRSNLGAVGTATGADLVVAERSFADGRARFYSYTTGAGQAIRFFVMKSADGQLRAAMDACIVCCESDVSERGDGAVDDRRGAPEGDQIAR